MMTRQNQQVPRRTFLKTGCAAAAAVSAPQVIPSGVLAAQGQQGANEKLTFAHIGVGGMGGYHLRDMKSRMDKGEVNIAAVCDVDENRLTNASKVAGPQADVYRAYRYVSERRDLDGVVIATPDHWHGVQMVHAAEAGKDVYVEKPACCTIEESVAMCAAAKKNKIAVQVGSQGRSQPEAYMMHRYLANEVIGKVSRVDCWHYPSPVDNNPLPDSDPPAELDWDLWLGPLRWRQYNPRYLHGVFRWLMESGGGQIRDRGAHVMSCAMWWMGADGTGPVTVEATGTVPPKGLWDSAINMNVTYTFKDPDWVLTWNQPGKAVEKEERTGDEPGGNISRPGYGALYTGTDGTCHHWGGDGGTWAEKKVRDWVPPAGAKDVYESPGHKEDWFKGMKTGEQTIMNIDAAAGVANLCILGNLSLILGRKLQWDQQKQEIVGDDEANRMVSRPQRHPYHL